MRVVHILLIEDNPGDNPAGPAGARRKSPRVLSEFRKHPACVTTPVIVVTSSDTPKERERMMDPGVAHYFKKPSDLNAYLMLGSLVREIVERSRAEPGNSLNA